MKLIHIDPDHPVYLSRLGPSVFGKDNWGKVNSFDKVLERGPIGRGTPFETGRVYRSLEMVFVQGRGWEETPLYRNAAAKIRAGRVMWKCTSPDALLQRLERDIGTLYRSMQEHGFLRQEQISRRLKETGDPLFAPFAREGYHARIRKNHEIKLALNEAGDVLFLDGRHRFGIARLLRLPAVPCRVVFRHRDWMRRRTLLEEAAAASSGSGPVHAAIHPDLAHLRLSERELSRVVTEFEARGWNVPEFRRLRVAG